MKQSWKILLLAVVFASCGTDSETSLRDDEYYALQIGSYWIYEVDEINYAGVGNIEEKHYQLLVDVVDMFEGATGGNIYVLHRSVRNSAQDAWSFEGTWSARITTTELVEVEGNTNIIKLAFPLYKNQRWDSNALNVNAQDEFVITGKDVSFDLGNGNTYKKALVVTQEDELTVLEQDSRFEVYARNVGLVYHQRIQVQFDEATLGAYDPAFGINYLQRLIDYGQE